jgi:hypothetical protein
MKKGIALLICFVFILATMSFAWPWSKKPSTEKGKTIKTMKKETKKVTTTKKAIKKGTVKPMPKK